MFSRGIVYVKVNTHKVKVKVNPMVSLSINTVLYRLITENDLTIIIINCIM